MRLAFLLLLTVMAGESVSSWLAADQPNIIFFLADDQRFDLMGCAGHEIIQTPAMDRLASDGVRFRNAFVTTSICAASRASFLTGLHERTHRYTFGTPPLAGSFCQESYPAVLRRAGYETVFIGKFGVNADASAKETMFDHFHVLHRNPYLKKQPDGSLRHTSRLCGDRAIDFLQSRTSTRPFCLSISFNAPHAEDGDRQNHFPPPATTSHLYADQIIPAPRLSAEEIFNNQPAFLRESMNRDRWFWRWDTPEKYQKNIRDYYRMISGIDHVMGRVLDELRKQNLADNTVVIFAGDNGYYAGSRGFAGKWSHYEESLRIPLIIMDPRQKDSSGRTVEATVLNIDVPPTILDLAMTDIPDRYQGSSLVPFLEGRPVGNWRSDFFCEHLMEHPAIPKWEGVRDNRWVYARYFQQDPPFEFLHDLRSDPDQLRNLATDPAMAETMNRMRARSIQLRTQLGGEFRPNPRK